MDDLEKYLDKQLENEEFKKEWEEFQPELQLMKKVIGERIKQNIKYMEYAIHSNELEGNITSDEDKEIFFKVATGELTIEEAKKIFGLLQEKEEKNEK